MTVGDSLCRKATCIGATLWKSTGSGGVKTVIVRGNTDEPASVKVKPGITTEWKDTHMLSGQDPTF
jgi:plastocyanin